MPNRWAGMFLLLLFGFHTAGIRAEWQPAPVNPDAKLLQEFQDRVGKYTDLRKKLEKGAPSLEETDKPEQIKAAQDVLAQRIRAARPGARQGEIFTPAIAEHFRKLMRPELKGPDALETKKTIKEDGPGAITLKVNARYPDEAPLPTVPPNLLLRLPKLPADLEYRVIGNTLILRDARANLIVDFLSRAIG